MDCSERTARGRRWGGEGATKGTATEYFAARGTTIECYATRERIAIKNWGKLHLPSQHCPVSKETSQNHLNLVQNHHGGELIQFWRV